MRNQQKSKDRSPNNRLDLQRKALSAACDPESTITLNELDTLLQDIPAYIFCKDNNNRLLRVNKAILDATGFREEDLIGKSLYEIFPKRDAEDYWMQDQEVLNTGRPKNGIVQRIVVNGGERWVRTDKIPQKDETGRPIGIIGIAFDITSPKLAPSDRTRFSEAPASLQEETNHAPEKKKRPRIYPSVAMRATMNLIQQAVSDNGTVLFVGESGSGKDFWARYIHESSRRSSGPFCSLNCSAGSGDAVRVQLFGRAPGALGGPQVAEKGILDVCKAGSLLLNNIGEADLQLQAKLLDFIDTRYFTRVGGTKRINVNTRVFMTADKDLDQQVSNGKFRRDLFLQNQRQCDCAPPAERQGRRHPGSGRGIAGRNCIGEGPPPGSYSKPQLSRNFKQTPLAGKRPGIAKRP